MELKDLRETDENVVILPGAKVNGQVRFGAGCSVWYNAVIRGDAAPISFGARCNIQDNAVVHSGDQPTVVGDDVLIGHGAIVHGCTIGSGTLIGMGSIVLDGAVIGNGCLVGAGALVTGGMRAPDGSLLLGSPAKVAGTLEQKDREGVVEACAHYAQLRERYR